MSELRKHLQAAKSKHLVQKYPGDLAQHVFAVPMVEYAHPRNARRTSPWRILGTVAAMAAAIAIVAGVAFTMLRNNGGATKLVVETVPIEPTKLVLDIVPETPANLETVPKNFGTLTPTYQSMSFSTVPTMWDKDDSNNNSNPSSSSSNAKESA